MRLKYTTKNGREFYSLKDYSIDFKEDKKRVKKDSKKATKEYEQILKLEKAFMTARIKKEENPIILAAAESGRAFPISLNNVVKVEVSK